MHTRPAPHARICRTYDTHAKLVTVAGHRGVAFNLAMLGRTATFLSPAHVRVDYKVAHRRRALAVRDISQDSVEILDFPTPRLVLDHTPFLICRSRDRVKTQKQRHAMDTDSGAGHETGTRAPKASR